MLYTNTASQDGPEGRVSSTIGAITQMMRSADLGPGDQLPSEATLSRDLNVSRTVIREAFRSLAAMRLIELSVGKRATVAELDYAALSPLIEHGVRTEQISVQQVYDVRRTIEQRTAALAALRRSDDQGREILAHATAMQVHADAPEKIMEHDLALSSGHRQGGPQSGLHADRRRLRRGDAADLADRLAQPHGPGRTGNHARPARGNRRGDRRGGDPQRAADLMAKHFDESIRALIVAGIS